MTYAILAVSILLAVGVWGGWPSIREAGRGIALFRQPFGLPPSPEGKAYLKSFKTVRFLTECGKIPVVKSVLP